MSMNTATKIAIILSNFSLIKGLSFRIFVLNLKTNKVVILNENLRHINSRKNHSFHDWYNQGRSS